MILMNHVGFVPRSAKHFVIARPPATAFTVTQGLYSHDVVCRGELRHVNGDLGDADDNPEPFDNNCSTEYDMPVGAPLLWLLSELTMQHEAHGRP